MRFRLSAPANRRALRCWAPRGMRTSLAVAFWVACLSPAACVSEGDELWSTVDVSLMGGAFSGATSVVLPIHRVELHVTTTDGDSDVIAATNALIDDDGAWHSGSVTTSVDLLSHTEASQAARLASVRVPPGKINQIRIFLTPGQPATLSTPSGSCAVDLSTIPSGGIKVTGPWRALDTFRGVSHKGILKLDLQESLNKLGDCYKLTPALSVEQWKTDGKTVVVY